MGRYEEEVKNMRHSFSRDDLFSHCNYAFYLGYILDKDDRNELGYISEGNFFAEVGSFMHEILAMILKGELSLDDAPQYYADNFDDYVCYKTKQSTMDKTYEACANYLADVDFNWLKDYEILGVELERKFKLGNYNFIGYIDLLLRDLNDNKLIVVDHKSAQYPLKRDGSVAAKSKKSFESYKRQLYLYSYAVKEQFGELPKEIWWNHFKVEKFVKIPFDMDEYNASLQWFIDTIRDMENEEDFPPANTKSNYFYCHNLCNFRNSCEYANGQSYELQSAGDEQ